MQDCVQKLLICGKIFKKLLTGARMYDKITPISQKGTTVIMRSGKEKRRQVEGVQTVVKSLPGGAHRTDRASDRQ